MDTYWQIIIGGAFINVIGLIVILWMRTNINRSKIYRLLGSADWRHIEDYKELNGKIYEIRRELDALRNQITVKDTDNGRDM